LHAPQTWHHGLMAEWWANFNLDGPEVEAYRPYLREPVLDAGCGNGRLLVPWHREGIDIDGCDASPDMVARCRDAAPAATLWVSSLHELEPPRKYATVICSGVFGLGSRRAQDEEAVVRLHDALEPGGTLVLDNEEREWTWKPRDWGSEPETRTTASGLDISLWSRADWVDDDDHCVHMTIRAEASDGRREEHRLTMRWWYREEIVPLLERSGFERVEVRPGVEERIVVYVAFRDGDLQPLPRRG
jgi:SAM-dependent methyltransferase